MKAETFKRIKEFIYHQRARGESDFGHRMMKRYSKKVDEIYEQYGDIFYYDERINQNVGINQVIRWHFRTLEKKISDLETQLANEKAENKGLMIHMRALQDAVNELAEELERE